MLFDISTAEVLCILVLVWYCICVFHLFLSMIRETMEVKGSCDNNT